MVRILVARSGLAISCAAAIMSVAVATGGIALAGNAGDRGSVIHGCRNVRTGILRVTSRCLIGEVPLIWNQAGPIGQRGPRGPTGLPGLRGGVGPTGSAGPSDAYRALLTQQVNLAQGDGNFGPVLATQDVPPGSYTVSANISVGTIATGDPIHLLSCEVSDANGLAAASDQQLTVSDGHTVTVGLSFADTTHSAGAFEIERFVVSAESFALSGELTVTAVGSLHG